MLPELIETERLTLRRARLSDAGEIFERYAQDPEVTRYLRWAPHQSVSETKEYLTELEASWSEGTGFAWVILTQANDRLMGMIELRNLEQTDVELGYVSSRESWGHGYMTEALAAVLHTAFDSENIDRVWAKCDLENVASQRVMGKAGMREESRERRSEVHPNLGEDPRECVVFSIRRPAK